MWIEQADRRDGFRDAAGGSEKVEAELEGRTAAKMLGHEPDVQRCGGPGVARRRRGHGRDGDGGAEDAPQDVGATCTQERQYERVPVVCMTAA